MRVLSARPRAPRRALGIGLAVALAGCASVARVDEGVRERLAAEVRREDVPCLQTLVREGRKEIVRAGSGTRLSSELVASCAHVWPPETDLGFADAEVVAWRVVAHGAGEGAAPDWVLLETEPAAAPGWLVDPAYRPRAGETILVCGYRAAERDESFPEERVPALALVAGEVVDPPARYAPEEELVYFRATDPVLSGLSGGPALAWDAARRRAVLFGIHSATIEIRVEGVLAERLHGVRRLDFVPPERLAAAPGGPSVRAAPLGAADGGRGRRRSAR